jgi:ribosomal protein L33
MTMALKLACTICTASDLRNYYRVAKKKRDQSRLDVILSVAKLRNINIEEQQK